MEMSEVNEQKAEAELESFREAMSRVEKLWNNHAFERWDGTRWRQQALAGMFDAQMLAASKLSLNQFERLRERSGDVVEATKSLFDDDQFEEAVRLGTNTPSRMRYRVSRVYDTLLTLI